MCVHDVHFVVFVVVWLKNKIVRSGCAFAITKQIQPIFVLIQPIFSFFCWIRSNRFIIFDIILMR